MIQREIMHRAIQPVLRLADLFKLRVQFHESFLHDVLRHAQFTRQPQGIIQQRRFERCKQLLNRLGYRWRGADLISLHYSHASIHRH